MVNRLKQKIANNILLLVMMVLLNGCIYLVVGSVGAVGGYIVSPDTVEGIMTGHSADEVWDAAQEVTSIMGIVLERSEAGGILIAKIAGSKVSITILSMSSSAVKLSVKARRAFFPSIKTAQEVYIKIDKYLGDEDSGGH